MKKLITFIIIVVTMLSFMSCEKKEIIGYDPETPQEWIDAEEEWAKNPNTEVVRTFEFDGIWRNETTGQYFHIYDGGIYLVKRPDATEEEVTYWGSATIVQEIAKTDYQAYSSGDVGLVPGEEQDIYLASDRLTENVVKIVILEGNRTKAVLESGREVTFKFIQEVTDGPAGYETSTDIDY